MRRKARNKFGFKQESVRMNRLFLCFALSVLTFPVLAGEASDVVRTFYDNPDKALEADNPRISEPMLSVLKANAASNEEPCIDFSPPRPKGEWNDYNRSVRLGEEPKAKIKDLKDR